MAHLFAIYHSHGKAGHLLLNYSHAQSLDITGSLSFPNGSVEARAKPETWQSEWRRSANANNQQPNADLQPLLANRQHPNKLFQHFRIVLIPATGHELAVDDVGRVHVFGAT